MCLETEEYEAFCNSPFTFIKIEKFIVLDGIKKEICERSGIVLNIGKVVPLYES